MKMKIDEIINTLNAIDNAIHELIDTKDPLEEWTLLMLWKRKRALEKLQLEYFQKDSNENPHEFRKHLKKGR